MDSRCHHKDDSIAILTNIPNHYRIPLFNVLEKRLDSIGLRLVVLFAAESYERRRQTGRESQLEDAEFLWEILPSRVLGRNRPILIPHGLARAIDRHRPAALVVAGTGTLALAAYSATRFKGTPWLVWSGEFQQSSRVSTHLERRLKRFLLRRAAAAITYGTAAAEFVIELAPEIAVFRAWNTVDLDPFLSVRSDLTPYKRRVIFITVGDLVEYKGYSYLLQALSLLEPKIRDRVEIRIVGTGPEESSLRAQTHTLGLRDHIQFLGAKPADQIPKILAEGDAFVFPSLGEPWGLALVEAMAAGLPVVASSLAGATRDLVVEGTGFAANPRDSGSFSSAMRKVILLSTEERQEMGERARLQAARLCNLENSVAGFVTAIEYVLRG